MGRHSPASASALALASVSVAVAVLESVFMKPGPVHSGQSVHRFVQVHLVAQSCAMPGLSE